MDEILRIDTISQYHQLFGFETYHPLVSIVDSNNPAHQENYRMTVGFYAPICWAFSIRNILFVFSKNMRE